MPNRSRQLRNGLPSGARLLFRSNIGLCQDVAGTANASPTSVQNVLVNHLRADILGPKGALILTVKGKRVNQ